MTQGCGFDHSFTWYPHWWGGAVLPQRGGTMSSLDKAKNAAVSVEGALKEVAGRVAGRPLEGGGG